MIDYVTAALFVVTFFLVAWYLSVPSNLPPGPRRWPIVGSTTLNKLGSDFDRLAWWNSLRQQYGDIVTIWVGGIPSILIFGPQLIRETLVNQAKLFSDRSPVLKPMQGTIFEHGIVNSQEWRSMRQKATSGLRDFGAGAASLENKILLECEAITQEFQKLEGRPFDCQEDVTNAVSNVICSIVFGKRYEYNDAVFREAMRDTNAIFQFGTIPLWAFLLPSLASFLKTVGLISMENKHLSGAVRFIQQQVDAHRATFDPEHPRDFVDLYLQSEGSETGNNDKSLLKLRGMILDLFLAGTETTSTTLRWLFVYMINYPDVQEKCHQEILEALGRERQPQMNDRPNLPYTEATLLEIQRHANIAPRTLSHGTRTPATLAGYHIPTNAMILAQLYSSHLDPEVWGDPQNFRPERWIIDGKVEADNPAFMPFSLGRRRCPGEQIAKMELFLFTVTFLQQFCIQPEGEKPTFKGRCGLTHFPLPFEMRATPRDASS